MNHMDPTYHWVMVGLPVLIAISSSYVGLDFFHKVGQRKLLRRSGWILLAAITLGIGFWSMHFVAILALHPMVTVHFDFVWTLLSLVPAVACSFAAFWLLARPQVQSRQIAAGSLFLGAGIVGLHYLATGAMHGSILLSYRLSFIVAACVVAVCGSYLTLRSLKPQQRLSRFGPFHSRLTSALILAVTAAGVHFVAMAGTAIQYVQSAAVVRKGGMVDQSFLPSYVAIAMFTIVILVLIGSYLNGQFHDALREAEQELAQTLRQQQGMTFKFKKIGNRFVHTLCDGELVYKMGFTPKSIVGKALSEILPTDAAIADKEQFYERAWRGEEVTYTGNVNGVEYLASLRPVFKYGTVAEVIASCIDITERNVAQDSMLRTEKMSLAGQLAAGVAHEIRNPLTSIKGFARLLSARVDPKSLQYLDIINQEVLQIEAIINEFLLLSKPQGDQTQQANVSWVVRDVTTLMAPEAMMKSVQIHAWFEDLGKCVQCAPNQLKQVFVNILKNAIDAAPEGGNVVIDIEATEHGTVVTWIRDDGPGIPPDRLERLGEPFYTTKERGTGLGLMISHRIIRDCGGDIRFTSEVGQGTTVEVVLPVVPPHLAEDGNIRQEPVNAKGI